MSRTIKCEHCGVEFEAKRITHKFCSKNCVRKNWYHKNKEKHKELTKRYIQNNLDKFRARTRAYAAKYRQENPDKHQAGVSKWKAANPDNAGAIARKTSYRKLGYPEELLEIKELQYQIKKEIKNQLKG